MFDELQGDWVSVSSEVPNYEVGKDRVRFLQDGYIEYLIERNGKSFRSFFEAVVEGDDYVVQPVGGYGFGGEPMKLRVTKINEDELGIRRIGLTTVYRRKR